MLQMMGVEFKAGVIRIKTEQFMQLFKTVHELNLPQIIKVFKINEDVAELVVPTILLYEQLLALVPVQEIILTDDRFIDGICLLHIGPKASKTAAFFCRQPRCCTISANTFRCAAIRCTAIC